MKKFSIQQLLDRIIDFLFLWAIPKSIKPNWVTYLRIISVPFVFWFLLKGDYSTGFVLFTFSACTDFIDGAMARRRDQITYLGKILDPIADKFLIGAALAAIAFEYVIVKVFLIFIFFEIISTISGAALKEKLGKTKGANVFGKIKMVLQSLAVIIFIFSLLVKSQNIRYFANSLLFIALIFAIFSAYNQVNDRISHYLKTLK